MATPIKRKFSPGKNEAPLFSRLALKITQLLGIQQKLSKEISSILGFAFQNDRKDELPRMSDALKACGEMRRLLDVLNDIKVEVRELVDNHKKVTDENAELKKQLDMVSQEKDSLQKQLLSILGEEDGDEDKISEFTEDEGKTLYTIFLK